jgi:hypothetical protein
MIKLLPVLGFGALFLSISPKLREVVMDFIASGVGGMVRYSPWSYVGAVVFLLLCAMLTIHRSSTHSR